MGDNMTTAYMIGLDQSTSGTKIVLVDSSGQIVSKESKSHKQYYPKPGWVEHDPMEIYNNCLALLKELRMPSGMGLDVVRGLSITNQRETIVLWDSVTKEPVYNAIVWQCRRGGEICERMKKEGLSDLIEEKTGLQLDPYFSSSKIKWALDNVPAVKESRDRGTLRIGTVDAWLIFKLTGGDIFATDHTNASRTMLYNIADHNWDETLLELFDVEVEMLPDILPSNAQYGLMEEDILGISMPIVGVIGDSQGALFGQQCFEVGMAKATYGTGSSILMHTGSEMIRSKKGILTSVAWGIDDTIEYAVEGIINSSGDTLKWVKDNLGLYQEDEEVDAYVQSIDSCEGVYIIPAFVGLGAPYWKPDSKASIVGMTRKTNKAHIIRAAVESMAYQVADLIQLMSVESGKELRELNVDGGPVNNKFLMQLQADLIQRHIISSEYQELSVLGAVYLGGLGIGLWKNKEALKSLKRQAHIYKPVIEGAEANQKIERWHKTVLYHTSGDGL